MSSVLTGVTDVDDDTTFPEGLNAANATFDLFNSARMTLLNDDVLYDTAITGTGLAVLGGRNIFAGLALGGDVTAVNHGPATQAGDLTLGTGDDATTLRNNDDGVWALTEGASISGSATSRFVNAGTFQKGEGDDVSDISVSFISPGAVDISTGTLNFSGPRTLIQNGISGSGAVVFSGGRATLGVTGDSATYDYTTDVDVAAGAILVLVGGFDPNVEYTLAAFHVFSGDDFLLEAGATLVLGPGIRDDDFSAVTYATLEGGAAQNNEIDGTIRDGKNEGAFQSSGTLHFGDGARVVAEVQATAATIDGRVVFDYNNSTVDDLTIDGGTLVSQGELATSQISGAGRLVSTGLLTGSIAISGDLTLLNSGEMRAGFHQAGGAANLVVRNLVGATWLLDDISADEALGGVVDNHGTITTNLSTPFGKDIGSDATFAALVHNNGVIETQYGAITMENAVDGAGQDFVAVGGFTFDAAVAASQSVVFNGDLGTLIVNDLPDFAATISQFDQNGASNFIDVDAAKWSFGGFTENTAGTGGALLFNGAAGASASLTLAGAYDASGFTATTADGKLQITYSAPH